jgi:hypothetical protein
METQFVYDGKHRNLALAFKEKFTTDTNWVVRVNGSLNTVTGKTDSSGSLLKYYFHPDSQKTPRKASDKDLRTKVAGGLTVDLQPRAEVRLAASTTHFIPFRPFRNNSAYVKLVGQAEYNPQTNKVSTCSREYADRPETMCSVRLPCEYVSMLVRLLCATTSSIARA